ncbi:hypothetical protein HDE78_000724 [Rhodanobacter sp. K2T2]|nr:hypothetical protein [Rhodanobacter sp. K2T2]
MSQMLDFLLGLPQPLPLDSTEADTRALVIDPLLRHLGWTNGDVKREPYAGWPDARGFIDYLLMQEGKPMMVLEAKKTGRSFSLPQNLTNQRVTTYKKVRATASTSLIEALDQCLQYAQHTGAIYACATNGSDWLFFKPAHSFRALPDARVVVFNGVKQVVARLDEFCALLGYDSVQEGQAEKFLLGRELKRPLFAMRLQDVFPYHEDPSWEEDEYSNILDQFLAHYVDELTSEDDFEQCYCVVRTNRATIKSIEALVSLRVDAAREEVLAKGGDFKGKMLSKPIFPEIPSGRTVVLHGDVGVGKSSFLRHCELFLRKSGKLQDSVWARVDLLPFHDRPFTADDRDQMLQLICREILAEVAKVTESMSGSYDPDDWAHLRDIYNSEVRRFQKARYPNADDSNEEYVENARRLVWDLSQSDPQEHLVRVIKWLTLNCRLPVVVALDNSDQLGLEFQEFLYKLSEKLRSTTSAVLILVMRTEALASHSIREHSIASVKEQFLIQKAPLSMVLEKRFERILASLPVAYPATAQKAARDRISVLIETIGHEASIGSDAFQIIQAAGNGSLRANLKAISAIFRLSPKAMDKLVFDQHVNGRTRLTVALTLRALMKDDLSSAGGSKLLPNVFVVDSQLTMPYSLGLRILQQVRAKSAHVNYQLSSLLNDFSLAGIDRVIVERAVQRLRFDRFLTVPHMLSDMRGEDIPSVARLGEVLLDLVLNEMSYVSRSAFETYIYDKNVYNNMRSVWASGPGDYQKKFDAIGRLFSEMVREDDLVLRRDLETSHLEHSINSPLPGLLSS